MGSREATRWAPLAAYFGANVLFGAGLFAHAFLYNFYLQALGLGPATMGLAAAALTAGGLAALVPAGVAVDRVGARAAFLVAVALAAGGLALGAVVARPAPIFAAAFLSGAGTAVWRVATGPILMRLAGGRTRSRAFSWNVALLLGSGAVWTAAAGSVPAWLERLLGIAPLASIRLALLGGAAGTLLASALFLAVWRRLTEAPRPHTAAPPRDAPSAPARRLAAIAVPAPLALAVGAVAVWMLAGGLVIPFFNVWFQREHALSIARIGVIFAAAQAVTALVVAASGELASRWGPARVLAVWALTLAPVLWLLPAAAALPLALALFLVQGFVAPATNPLIDQVLLESAAPERHGVVSSWRNAATEGSGLAGASIGGFLLEQGSFDGLFAVAGAVAALGGLALIAALRWLRKTAATAAADQAASPAGGASSRIETAPRASSQARSR